MIIFVQDIISTHISPKLDALNDILEKRTSKESEEADDKNAELFSLCKDQILKCSCLMADIFKREISNSCVVEVCFSLKVLFKQLSFLTCHSSASGEPTLGFE